MTDPDDSTWPRGFEEHSAAQSKRRAALSLAEKLDWLEEAHRLVLSLRAAKPQPPDPKEAGDA